MTPNPNPEKSTLTARELAARLQISVRHLGTLLVARRVPPALHGLGRVRRWSRMTIAAWEAAGMIEPGGTT